MEPTLSIIIPCYNGEKFLTQAVSSILKQPCRELEIIIVDDGSSDSSGAIADSFAAQHDNIRVFHIPNGGVSAARNVGIDHALGRYIGFLDADDVLCRDAYNQQISDTLKSGKYDIISFSYLTALEDLQSGCVMRVDAPGVHLRDDRSYIRQTEKHFCSYLYNRRIFTDVIRFPEGIRYNEDLCFLFLATRNGRNIMQYEKPWFIYRMNTCSVMHSLQGTDYLLEAIEGIWWCLQNSSGQKNISDCRGNLFACMVKYIRISCMQGVPVDAIRNNLLENKPFQSVMEYYGSFWIDEQTANLYSAFMNDSRKIWRKYRMKGIFQNAASRLLRTRVGNFLNRKLRYKVELGEYLVK